MIGKFLDPKNDFAFKKIFGTEKHKDILIHFLNDVLEFSDGAIINDVTFLSPIQDPEIASKKESIVDVLCQDQDGRQHIVEMQVAKTKGFEKRAQYYAAKAYTNQLDKGVYYHRLKEVIFLAIADFEMFPDKSGYKSDHVILDKESYENDLKDFSFTFLELPKFRNTKDKLKTMLEKWCYFFKYAARTSLADLEKIIDESDIIKKAYHALEASSWSEAELAGYEKAEKQLRDWETTRAHAYDSGKKEGEQLGLKKGEQLG
ncbi:Rpn family recombination-promoting nuclease/putative transposase, partial [Cardinium endosymbiont of Culicoides punctatus]|uniref:Rpn family recombination-promoting nuclease/putative transposase n=1 Tax=Cardinium endosymbiont of Culicoides punctatus TaxID=2304601 RepID=UPI001058E45A